MALSSQISAIVASQIGKIEGDLEARIQLEANKMLGNSLINAQTLSC